MKLANLKVSHRLTLGFGVLIVLLTGSLAFAVVQMSDINQAVQVLTEDRMPKVNLANKWTMALLESARHERNMLIVDGPEAIQKEMEGLQEYQKIRVESKEQLEKTVVLAKGKVLLNEAIEARNQFVPAEQEFIRLIKAGDKEAAKEVMLQKMKASQLLNIQALEKLAAFEQSAAREDGENAAKQYATSRTLIMGLIVLSILIGVGSAVAIARSLLAQLGGEPSDAANVAQRIASGDLNVSIGLRHGDTSSMMHSMKEMTERLRTIVGEVRMGAETIANATGEIAKGNLDLSSRTEEQAASLEETASSMEELTATIGQNAENARRGNELSQAASTVAVQGGDTVSHVVQTMEQINHASKRIVDIISVIDGIAFQTNILALNAAVEAARAGEQGRGFAVVAAEVRNLAQRSASAAKEIKALIGDSVDKVEAGTRLVNDAGETMLQVVESVRRVTAVIGEISSASAEQSSGVSQINQAVAQMDEVTQQNAALVEEAAAAAGALQEQAQRLLQAVSVFQLDGVNSVPRNSVAALPMGPGKPGRTNVRPLVRPDRRRLSA
ncbi:MAG TPA: methyl-accepting chemotaxis protein [Burkholderiaceae bacterium]